MDIRFVSSLTPDDERRFATALMAAVGNLLAHFPISYSIRIQTTAGHILEDSQTAAQSTGGRDPGRMPPFGRSDPIPEN